MCARKLKFPPKTSLALPCCFLLGCSPRTPHIVSPPLPTLPLNRQILHKVALQEAQKRLEQNQDPALSHWRRLTWLQYHQSDRKAALHNLDRACAHLDASYFTNGQEPVERSILAEHYLAMKAPDQARAVLGDFRYVGSAPQAQKALARTTLTPLELKRLENPDAFLAPRLIVALLHQGPREPLKEILQPRLEFALMRGPQGERTESFHGAIVLQFYFCDPHVALRATEQQSPTDRVRTLGSLCWGGTISPGATLFFGDTFPAIRTKVNSSLGLELRQRLLRSLPEISPNPDFDLELTALMILATQEGAWTLAEEAARHVSDSLYRAQVQQALAAKRPVLMPSLNRKPGERWRVLLMGRRLSQLVGMSPGAYQDRLLEQFLGELVGTPDEKLFATHLAVLFRKRGRLDLLARLLARQPDPAFHCHQALLDVQAALKREDRQAGEVSLKKALLLLERIPKISHKAQEGLLAQELARQLANRDLLLALEDNLTKILPKVTIPLLRTDLTIRLAGLHALCGNTQDYKTLVTSLQGAIPTDSGSAQLVGDLLERLTREQVRVGRVEDAWESIRKIDSPLLQASALLGLAEAIQPVPPQPASQSVPSLQNGGRGLLLSAPR